MKSLNQESAVTPLRVLIVNDEPPARARLRDLLDDCRAQVPNAIVGEAGSGLEGLDLLASKPAGGALVDIHMPGMSGIEFARHLQLLEVPPAVIFVTAHDRYAVEAFEVNAVDYLIKASLAQLEAEFAALFIRIHRNCLVARRLIRGFERLEGDVAEANWAVLIEGCQERLPVSRRQWAQVKALAKS